MASIRKRNGKWQVQVRRKELGAVSQSFTRRDDALKWARIQEQRMEAGTFGHLMPSEVTLGDLLQRYLHAVTPVKKGATQEARRIRRLFFRPNLLEHNQQTASAYAFAVPRQKTERWHPCKSV